jgi:hypothetical protein
MGTGTGTWRSVQFAPSAKEMGTVYGSAAGLPVHLCSLCRLDAAERGVRPVAVVSQISLTKKA